MSECCVREYSLEEEIKMLEIDDGIKERMLRKVERIVDENHKQGDALYNCHCEMDRLNRAIISQAKLIGSLEEEIRSKSISCNF